MQRDAVIAARLRSRQNDALHLLFVRFRIRQNSQVTRHRQRLICLHLQFLLRHYSLFFDFLYQFVTN